MKRGGGGACLDNPWKLLAYAARKVAKNAFDWRSSGAGMWFPGWPDGEKVRGTIEVIRNVHNQTDRFQRRLLIKTPICLGHSGISSISASFLHKICMFSSTAIGLHIHVL